MTIVRRPTLLGTLAFAAIGLLVACLFIAWLAPANLAGWMALASFCG